MGEFDGIKEREEGKSKMPLAMTILFLDLVIFGLVYLYLFSPQTTGWTQGDQYQRRMDAFKKSIMTHEVQEVAAGVSEGKADQGQEIYKADCAMCHGENLEGGIGPALTGPKFVYGSTLADHVRVITDGTPK